MTIKDGINDFPSFFINGFIYGAKTDLLEDGLREDAVKQTRRRTESVKAPLNGLRLHYRRGRTSASSPSSPPLAIAIIASYVLYDQFIIAIDLVLSYL